MARKIEDPTATSGGRSTVWSFGRNDAVWEHRTHPLSFWTRLAVLPALGATLWVRQWIDPGFLVILIALVAIAWIAERVFPAPVDSSSWATRASLGERLLASRRPTFGDTSTSTLRAFAAIGSIGTLIMVSGAIVLDATTTLVGAAIMIGTKLVYFDRLARVYDATATRDSQVAAWGRRG